MTREEFLEDVVYLGDLIDFCNDVGCYVTDDIYCEDSYNDTVDDIVAEDISRTSWQNIRNYLNDLPEGYEYYTRDDYGGWYGVDTNDFDSYKDDVLDWCDRNDIWDDDEENDDDEDIEDGSDRAEDNSDQLPELIAECFVDAATYIKIGKDSLEDKAVAALFAC